MELSEEVIIPLLIKSPYLNAHPEYLARLGRAESNERSFFPDGEYVNFLCYQGDILLGQTGDILISRMSRQNPRVISFWDRRKKIRHLAIYRKVHNGRPHSVELRIPSPPRRTYPNGKSQVVVDLKNPRYPDAVRKARDRVGRDVKQRPPRSSSPPRSSPLRPSPESYVVAFTKVHEDNQNPFTGGIGPVVTEVTPQSRLYYLRTWSGSRTPGFFKLRPSQYPVNPHSVYIKEVSQDLDLVYRDSNIGKFFVDVRKYTENIAEPADPVHLPLARNKAIGSLIRQAQLGVEANIAQDFAQIGQIPKMIAHNATKIASSIRNLRRGNISQAVDDLTAGRSRTRKGNVRKGNPSRSKDLAENWLEMQYGWKPLLDDIHGVMEALSKLQTQSNFVQSATSSATARSDSSFRSSHNESSSTGTNKLKTSLFQTTSCKLKLRYRVASPLKSFLAQTGFTNPINLVWEVLPFSFVADWFLPIGPFLEALTAWDGLEFLDGSQTLFTRGWILSTVDYSGPNVGNPSNGNSITQAAAYQKQVVLLDRTKLSSFPTLTFPQFKNGLASVSHAQNAIALLRTLF